MKKTRCNFSRAKVRIKFRTFPLSPPKFFRPTPFFCDWHTPPKDFYGMLPQRDIYSYGGHCEIFRLKKVKDFFFLNNYS